MAPLDDDSPARPDRTAAAILDAAARVFAAEGAGANLASVATAAGVSRATLYRYYANRDALLDALAADATADIVRRLADAGLERATVEEAVERVLRALVTVGDRYAALVTDTERVGAALPKVAAPIHAVLTRGVGTGVLRDDLPVEAHHEFLAGVALSALKLTRKRKLGLEEAVAAAARLFLDGSRAAARPASPER